ncbi:MAG: hypothetical protein MJ082_00125 [Clostridia bacterium]|nr:hypothetical protein [Clostridia bacterium]
MSFLNDYLFLNLSDYYGDGFDFPITLILLALSLGLILACIAVTLSKKSMFLLTKQLIRHGALSKEEAKTLTELGLKNNRGVRRLLKAGGQMKSFVAAVRPEDPNGQVSLGEISPETAKFYILPDQSDRARRIYGEGAPSALSLAITLILIAGVFLALMFTMPSILASLAG